MDSPQDNEKVVGQNIFGILDDTDLHIQNSPKEVQVYPKKRHQNQKLPHKFQSLTPKSENKQEIVVKNTKKIGK